MTDERKKTELSVIVTALSEETAGSAAKTSGGATLGQRAAAMASAIGDGGKSLAARGARGAQSAASAVGEGAAKAAKKTAKMTASSASSLGRVANAAGARAATAAGVASGIAHSVGDLNGDGKVDEEDFRIARDAVSKAAVAIGAEAAVMGKAVLRHEMTKDAMAGAAIGAVAAVPIPFVGPALGAAAGALFAVTRGVLTQPASDTLAGQALTAGASAASGLVNSAMNTSKVGKKPKSKTGGSTGGARSKRTAPSGAK